MAAPKKYPDELRDRAVRLVLEAKKDPGARSGAVRRIGEQLGINPGDVAGLGESGRGRRGHPRWHHDGRGSADRGPGARES